MKGGIAMRINASTALATGLAALAAGPAVAADEEHLSTLVTYMRLTETTPGVSLGLRNLAAIKTVAARKLTVTGDEPTIEVTGIVGCRDGATLTKVQAAAAKAINNGGEAYIVNSWGASAEDTSIAGKKGAQVKLSFKLHVTRTYHHEAVDLSFNPARVYEKKIEAFVAKGGSAAQYLHTDDAFDMQVPISLIAWCRMNPNADFMAGKTQAGVVTREIKATILFHGDPRIVDGIGVINANKGSGGMLHAPTAREKPKRATPPPKPSPTSPPLRAKSD
jgi:hypothetical protein